MSPAYVKAIAAGVVLGCLLVSPSIAAPAQYAEPKILTAFDQELFELAHTVFLANSSLNEALAVTEMALRAHPSDTVWRTKGAQTAEWAGKPDLALQHWFFLARKGDKNAAQSALRISRSMNELPLRKMLLEQLASESGEPALHKEYLAVVEGLGLPEEAYTLLTSGRIGESDRVWQLTEQARLAELLGRMRDAFDAWEKRAVLKPLTTDESLHIASLWYGQGEAGQALNILRQALPATPGRNTPFWRAYSDLAWALQEIPEAVRGSEMLVDAGTATESDYQRIQTAFQESDPARVYPIALEGWRRFSKPVWWYALVETGLRSGHAEELAKIYSSMTPEQRRLLSVDGRSWYYLSQVHRQNGDYEASLKAAKVAVQCEKSNVGLLSGYLWLLVDLKRIEELRPLVMEWESRLADIPELREPLAAAMMLLGEPSRALPVYRILARLRQSDPGWLASYGDVLEQAGHPEAAWQVRRHARNLVVAMIRQDTEPLAGRRNLLTRAQLMMHVSPGDDLSRLIRRIAEGNNDDSRELVMGWAMSTGQTDLARLWYWRSFARSTELPEWAKLGLALEANDHSGVADLIEARLKRLPVRDAIEGARNTGMIRIAESHAFDYLQLNPDDHLLDQQLRELATASPGYIRYALTLEDQSNVGWLQNLLSISRPYNGRYALKTEISERQFRQLKRDSIGTLPSSDVGGGVTVTRRHEGGYLALSFGMRDGGYNNFATTALGGEWRLYSDLGVAGRIDYSGRSEESAPLSVAGVRDRLSLSAAGTLTSRDSLALELAAMRYLDQHRQPLGKGMSVHIDLRHQMTSAWPDCGVRGYGGYTATSADGALSADTAALIPANTAPSTSFYVPEDFGQIGVGGFVGQVWKNVYTREWKPFAEVDIGWTNNAGFGYSYGAGVVGPLFGYDQLKLELHQSSGQFGTKGLTSRINLEYNHLY